MIKGRRVGTFTTGIVLVIFGIMFLIHLIYPSFSYLRVASLWPVVLVLLGIEIIVACLINKEELIKYDFCAIILILMLSLFSMGMGVMEYMITHTQEIRTIF
ncbi:LiaI-LiaF-like domain-containing protein [Clostridium lacusfryxellense]|uniref:LiaI-LiaF-like domain-containing protein n=1 Tax=Clostridium lacusfryxellense TaxID=205328 RepID=UPI001C0B2E95|nr:DUF5668 domain-containing protein [Clostridium lacusfryxellense]MBU3110084.1 hypothetical protein [Clostridium lacusfryxellense]